MPSLGTKYQDGHPAHQRPGRDRTHQVFVRPSIPLTSVSGASRRLVRVERQTGRGKQSYCLALSDGSPLSFATLWERWDKGGESFHLESFTVITTAASRALGYIYHRQLAIIESDRFGGWLDPTSSVPWLLELVREPRTGPYKRRAVSMRVNNVRNDDPGIVVPVSGERLI